MSALSEWAARQQVFAAWLQAAGVVLAALVALAIYALSAWRAQRRRQRRERQFIETALALGHEARRLAYDGVLMPASAELAPQAHQLGLALLHLPLERAPDAGLIAPLLQLRRHVERIAQSAARDAGARAAELEQLRAEIDAEIKRIEAVARTELMPPRPSLRHRTERGMPTTTVDRYSTFKFSDELYAEEDGVDFEAVVNNQSVRCTMPYAELNQLAAACRIPGQHHRGAFEQGREAIQRAAETLIREGAKAPVIVRFGDLEDLLAAPAGALKAAAGQPRQ